MSDFKLSDYSPTDRIIAAVLGDSGAGKTFFAGTAPNPAFLDVDQNIGTLKSKKFREAFPEIDVGSIRLAQPINPVNKDGMFTSTHAFFDAVEQLNDWAEDPSISTIVIDSLTSLSHLAQQHALELNARERRSETWSKAQVHKAYLMTIQDFGAEMSLIEQVLAHLRNWPKHILVLCHTRPEYNSAGGLVAVDPLITGSAARKSFGRWFNEVWYLDVRGLRDRRKRVMVTESDHLIKGLKTTLGLPREIEDPSFPKILKIMRGED
jgi:hypothetical protein